MTSCINPKASEAGWRVAFCRCALCEGKVAWRGRFGVVCGVTRFKINDHIDGGFFCHDRQSLSGARFDTIEAAVRWATKRVEG